MPAFNLRVGAVTALSILWLACTIGLLNQNEELRALRQRNQEQANRIEQLTAEVLGFSNRMAHTTLTQAPPSDGLREILRLRGETGVLRGQLQDFQRLMERNESFRSNGLSAETVQRFQVRAQKAWEGLNTLRNWCQENEADREWLLEATCKDDVIMASFKEQRAIAAKTLANPALDPAQIESIKASISDLDTMIKKRSEGMWFGLNVKLEAFKQVLDDLPTAEGDARLRAIASLHDLVNQAEITIESSR